MAIRALLPMRNMRLYWHCSERGEHGFESIVLIEECLAIRTYSKSGPCDYKGIVLK